MDPYRSSDFLEFSLVTDVWQQRFPRFFASDRRLATAISSTFRCCQMFVNSVFHLFFVLTQVFARFQQSCTLGASLQMFCNSIGSLSQTLYCAQLTEDITNYKHPPIFFFSNSLKILTLLISNMSSLTSSYIFFKRYFLFNIIPFSICTLLPAIFNF